MFNDRTEAGIKLSERLATYAGTNAVLLAIPRGAVEVAAVMARKLKLPMDVVLTKKIGHPMNPELAIGAVSLEGVLLDKHHNVPDEYITRQVEKTRKLLAERDALYHRAMPKVTVKGRTVILVDDGIATGYTMMACIELLREQQPSAIVVAVPLAPVGTILKIERMADETICLETPDPFYAIGSHYINFQQVDDKEVIRLLENTNALGFGREQPSL